MKIQLYESQVGVQNAGGGGGGGYVSTNAFQSAASQTPQALANFAGAMNKLNGQLFDQHIKERQEQLEIDAIKDMQDLSSKMSAFQSDFMQNNRGPAARGGDAALREFGDKHLGELRGRYSHNQQVLKFIETRGGGLVQQGADSMRSFALKEEEGHRDSVHNRNIAETGKVWSDPNSTFEQRAEALAVLNVQTDAIYTSKGRDPGAAKIAATETLSKANRARLQGEYELLLATDPQKAAEFVKGINQRDIAGLSAHMESGRQGSAAIGYDTNGGTSYGRFQISSKAGSMDSFIGFLEKQGEQGAQAAKALREAGPANTGGKDGTMPQVWAQLVKQGAITDEVQEQFIRQTHYDPVLAGQSEEFKSALNSDPRIGQALFSTSVQHRAGAASRMAKSAWDKSGGKTEQFISNLYNDRFTQFGSSTPEVQSSVKARLRGERDMLLASGGASFTPEELGVMEKKATDEVERFNIKQSKLTANGTYSALFEQTKSMGLEEQDVFMMQSIQAVENPIVQHEMLGLWREGKSMRKAAYEAEQYTLLVDFTKTVAEKGMSPLQAINEAHAIKGISDENLAKLEKFYTSNRNVDSPEKRTAAQSVLVQIDKGELDRQKLDLFIMNNALTEKQEKQVNKYFEDNGKEGSYFAKASFSKVGSLYKNLTKKKDFSFEQYEDLANYMPDGKSVNDATLRTALSRYIMDGEKAGGGMGYGEDMPYPEAKDVGHGANWLPDLKSKQKEEAAKGMKAAGIENPSGLQMRNWWRVNKLELPPVDLTEKKADNSDFYLQYEWRNDR